jgi:hypothetical protein
MTKIFESPDKGATVYARDFESLANSALQHALERAKIVYHLSKENNGN